MHENRLKHLRSSRKWTQRQVAEKAGMSVSYYTELEQGKKQLNQTRMEDLAAAFGCDVAEIIGESQMANMRRKSARVEAKTEASAVTTAAKLGQLDSAQLALVDQLLDQLLKK